MGVKENPFSFGGVMSEGRGGRGKRRRHASALGAVLKELLAMVYMRTPCRGGRIRDPVLTDQLVMRAGSEGERFRPTAETIWRVALAVNVQELAGLEVGLRG